MLSPDLRPIRTDDHTGDGASHRGLSPLMPPPTRYAHTRSDSAQQCMTLCRYPTFFTPIHFPCRCSALLSIYPFLTEATAAPLLGARLCAGPIDICLATCARLPRNAFQHAVNTTSKMRPHPGRGRQRRIGGSGAAATLPAMPSNLSRPQARIAGRRMGACLNSWSASQHSLSQAQAKPVRFREPPGARQMQRVARPVAMPTIARASVAPLQRGPAGVHKRAPAAPLLPRAPLPLRFQRPRVAAPRRGPAPARAFLSTEQLVGLAIFFSPSVAALIYAFIKGKGNLTDGLSRLLTEVSQVGAGPHAPCLHGHGSGCTRENFIADARPAPRCIWYGSTGQRHRMHGPPSRQALPAHADRAAPGRCPRSRCLRRATSSRTWAARTSRWRRASCLTWPATSHCSRRCTSGASAVRHTLGTPASGCTAETCPRQHGVGALSRAQSFSTIYVLLPPLPAPPTAAGSLRAAACSSWSLGPRPSLWCLTRWWYATC